MNRPRRPGLQIDDPLGPGPSTHEQPTATQPRTDHTAAPHEDKAAERSRDGGTGSARPPARSESRNTAPASERPSAMRHAADWRDRGSRRARRPPLAGVDRPERRGQLPSAARAAGRTRRHRPGTAAADRDDRHRRDHTAPRSATRRDRGARRQGRRRPDPSAPTRPPAPDHTER